MIRIAICDDNSIELSRTVELVKAYIDRTGKGAELVKYSSSVKLMKEVDTAFADGTPLFDLFILDVMMPEVTGMDIAEHIRTLYKKDVSIAFTTTSTEFAFKAFSVHAFRYLDKPLKPEAIAEMLDYFFDYMSEKEEKIFTIPVKGAVVTVKRDDIMYVENVSRNLVFSMADGSKHKSVSIRKSFETSVEPLLMDKNFIQPHKSFLVNMYFIKSYSGDNIVMEDGNVVPISRNNAAMVKKEYLYHLSHFGGRV